MNLAEFVIRIEALNANVDISLLRRAYEFSEAAHEGQKRASGEPFFNHCIQTAFILAEQHLDTATLAAGLIHDVVEDTRYSVEAIKGEFGEEIALLVDGVTKMEDVRFTSNAEVQVQYFRKMLLSMAADIRVIIIKLADRLHNMRTLEFLTPEQRSRIARETREVYAPLAHRFGMARIKWELEDLSLKYLDPAAYEDLVKKITLTREEREGYIKEVAQPLSEALAEEGIKAEITGRAKHFDSIYRKMKKRRKPVEEIFDLMAIRVLTATERECYHVLGIVHSLWTPVIDRFHDYIATPKTNMYQSLHTTIIGPRGRTVEIQIRTREMHRTAEYGIASHWLYKEGRQKADETDRRIAWLREVLEWQKDTTNPSEFMDFLKTDLFRDEIYVFTPQGELLPLPRGATPIDFAFAVHTQVGYQCTGAKINGRIVSLHSELHNGDEVQIITSAHHKPSHDWLQIAKTAKARSKIRAFLKRERFEESIHLGREMLTRELKKRRVPLPTDNQLDDLAMSFSFSGRTTMLARIGDGSLSLVQVINKIAPEKEKRPPKTIVARFLDRARGKDGVRIQDLDQMMFRFAGCCQPVPGEEVIGYITRGRGISVHRADCPNALILAEEPERRIEVEWDVEPDRSFLVQFSLVVENRKRILSEITNAISELDTNIRLAEITGDTQAGTGRFIVEIKNLKHLKKVQSKIRAVKGVLTVERTQGFDADLQVEPGELGE
jgi:GTP pyrophosphokinase